MDRDIKTIAVRVDTETYEQLKAQGKANHRKVGPEAGFIIKQHLDGREGTADVERMLSEQEGGRQ